jgi:hypothetical protein
MSENESFKPKDVRQKDAQSVFECTATDSDSWEIVEIKDFVQFLYPGRTSGAVGAIQLYDDEDNLVAWVWFHDQESLPETYVFPYNGRVEMHFKQSVKSDLINMLTSETAHLYFSIDRQEAHLTAGQGPSLGARRSNPSDERHGERRTLDRRQNVIPISQERRKGPRRQHNMGSE